MRKIVLVIIMLISIGIMFSCANKKEPNTQQKEQKVVAPKLDYEHDIVERCKDWIFARDQIRICANKGDMEGAAKYRTHMNAFYNDLRKIYSDEEISKTISEIEAKKKR